MTDDRWQTTDDRWQMTDDRWQMTDDRWQMTDDRRQMADDRWQTTDDRWKMIDDRRQKTDDRWQMTDRRQITDYRWQMKMTDDSATVIWNKDCSYAIHLPLTYRGITILRDLVYFDDLGASGKSRLLPPTTNISPWGPLVKPACGIRGLASKNHSKVSSIVYVSSNLRQSTVNVPDGSGSIHLNYGSGIRIRDAN